MKALNALNGTIMVLSLCGCATSSYEQSWDATAASEIASRYIRDQGWQIKHEWKNAKFHSETGEWEMTFDTTAQGCPIIVYVQEKTGAVRQEKGTP